MARPKPVFERPGAALVTGATSGLGLELAHEFARNGHDLVLVGRDEGKLARVRDEIAGFYPAVRVDVFKADLSDPGSPQKIFNFTVSRKLEIAHLVNNAGFASLGPLQGLSPARIHEMVGVNFSSPVALTHLFLPGMLARGRGRILNVSSLSAVTPGPRNAPYHATKSALASFSHSLSAELAGTGVTVTALLAGPMRTGFAKTAGMAGSRVFNSRLLPVMRASEVASKAYGALMKGKREVIPGWQYRALAAFTRGPLTPPRSAKITGFLYAKPKPRRR